MPSTVNGLSFKNCPKTDEPVLTRANITIIDATDSKERKSQETAYFPEKQGFAGELGKKQGQFHAMIT